MKYSFIGCGNMGGAVARALSKVTTDFLVTDRSGRAKGNVPISNEMCVIESRIYNEEKKV